MKLAKDQD